MLYGRCCFVRDSVHCTDPFIKKCNQVSVMHVIVLNMVRSNIRIRACNYLSTVFSPLNAELNPICHLPALLGTHHILHVSGLRVNGISEDKGTVQSTSKSLYPTFSK